MSLQFSSSLMSSLPAEAGCETRERIFYYWPLLRNNSMATNFEDALQVMLLGVLPHVL